MYKMKIYRKKKLFTNNLNTIRFATKDDLTKCFNSKYVTLTSYPIQIDIKTMNNLFYKLFEAEQSFNYSNNTYYGYDTKE